MLASSISPWKQCWWRVFELIINWWTWLIVHWPSGHSSCAGTDTHTYTHTNTHTHVHTHTHSAVTDTHTYTHTDTHTHVHTHTHTFNTNVSPQIPQNPKSREYLKAHFAHTQFSTLLYSACPIFCNTSWNMWPATLRLPDTTLTRLSQDSTFSSLNKSAYSRDIQGTLIDLNGP